MKERKDIGRERRRGVAVQKQKIAEEREILKWWLWLWLWLFCFFVFFFFSVFFPFSNGNPRFVTAID